MKSKIITINREDDTYGNFQAIWKDSDGWELVSPKGRHYDLLEGTSYGGITTSDIVFIFETTGNGYKQLINYLFGASEEEDLLKNAAYDIDQFERFNKKNLDTILVD